MKPIIRPPVLELEKRLKEKRLLIQVLMGPRQVGKTTTIHQLLERNKLKVPKNKIHFVTADENLVFPPDWLREQWKKAESTGEGSLLIVDEVHKIDRWSEVVKGLWDQAPYKIKVILLGSSSLELQKGMSESLTGRFELIRMYHWDFSESKRLSPMTLDQYLMTGGYPGAYRFLKNKKRFQQYIKNSIIETVIGKDILSHRSVRRPGLFRQAFEILCHYPAQEISYNKLLGQLQEKGNVDLVKHYIELYEGAFLFKTLQKFSAKKTLSKSSSPKILPLCPALITSSTPLSVADPELKGRIFEAVVGSALSQLEGNLYYWRDGDDEVDYVYECDFGLFAIEVKSGRRKRLYNVSVFKERFEKLKPRGVLIAPEDFELFLDDPEVFLKQRGF